MGDSNPAWGTATRAKRSPRRSGRLGPCSEDRYQSEALTASPWATRTLLGGPLPERSAHRVAVGDSDPCSEDPLPERSAHRVAVGDSDPARRTRYQSEALTASPRATRTLLGGPLPERGAHRVAVGDSDPARGTATRAKRSPRRRGRLGPCSEDRYQSEALTASPWATRTLLAGPLPERSAHRVAVGDSDPCSEDPLPERSAHRVAVGDSAKTAGGRRSCSATRSRRPNSSPGPTRTRNSSPPARRTCSIWSCP